jgi:hypothetical protein
MTVLESDSAILQYVGYFVACISTHTQDIGHPVGLFVKGQRRMKNNDQCKTSV